jgi:hypothetical protein
MTLSLGEEDIVINVDVVISGLELTTSIGNTNITAWAEIDPGVTNTWAPVDLAA